jgi:uncharacterized damage-inducible protein DinB
MLSPRKIALFVLACSPLFVLPSVARAGDAAQAATDATKAASAAATSATNAAAAMSDATKAAQAAGHAGEQAADAAKAAAAAMQGKSSGFQADLLADYGYITGHLLALADAVPAEKYGWRPGEGVRSFAEVIGHVAAANYYGSAALGTPTPAGVNPGDLEKVADKAQSIANLKAAIAQFQKAVGAVDASALDDKVDLFGMSMTKRRVMLTMQGHAHEHTGQAIAYARVNGIVPPWSKPAAASN